MIKKKNRIYCNFKDPEVKVKVNSNLSKEYDRLNIDKLYVYKDKIIKKNEEYKDHDYFFFPFVYMTVIDVFKEFCNTNFNDISEFVDVKIMIKKTKSPGVIHDCLLNINYNNFTYDIHTIVKSNDDNIILSFIDNIDSIKFFNSKLYDSLKNHETDVALDRLKLIVNFIKDMHKNINECDDVLMKFILNIIKTKKISLKGIEFNFGRRIKDLKYLNKYLNKYLKNNIKYNIQNLENNKLLLVVNKLPKKRRSIIIE